MISICLKCRKVQYKYKNKKLESQRNNNKRAFNFAQQNALQNTFCIDTPVIVGNFKQSSVKPVKTFVKLRRYIES